jgi:2-oxoisovalerate dehydrogenase E1 component
MPVPEIQFRKYADPSVRADQRLRHDALAHGQPLCRADGGADAGRLLQVRRSLALADERSAVRARPGWRVACPSNAEDAVGLLRTALRGNDPVMFLEHRNMLDAASARRPYPGDDFALPFGVAKRVREGDATSRSSPGARWWSAAKRRRKSWRQRGHSRSADAGAVG